MVIANMNTRINPVVCMGKPYNQNKNGSGLTNSGPPTKACNNCGLNNHDTSECRRPRINQRGVNNNDIVCFACNKVGHKRSQCPMNRVTHKTAAMQQINNDGHGNNWTHTRSHQCDNTQCEDMGQIKLLWLHVTGCGRCTKSKSTK